MEDEPEGEHRPTLSVVGAGRAGSAIAVAAHGAGYPIRAVASPRRERAAALAGRVGANVVDSPLAAMRAADITLLTVPDGAITRVAATIAATGATLHDRAVVHVSGRFGPDVAAALRVTGADVGALHPLQALAGPESTPLLRGSYFRLEAGGRLAVRLRQLVDDIGGHVIAIPEHARAVYHAAATLAGNAPLALLARATSLLEDAGVDRETAHAALATLMAGAALNAARQDPVEALTGPIARGDADAVAAHLKALEPYPDVRDLYLRMASELLALATPPATPLATKVA